MRKRANKLPDSSLKGTKKEIFEVAVNMFANRGYANVGIRDIANSVGIKSSSIYNHFENKDAVLERIFQYFEESYYTHLVSDQALLAMIPDTPLNEILENVCPAQSDKNFEVYRKIMLIAVAEYNNNNLAKKTLYRMFEVMTKRLTLVLTRLNELGLIEPIDIDLFATLMLSYNTATTLSNYSGTLTMPYDKWKEGREMLFGLVRKR